MQRATCPACEAPAEADAKACLACGEPFDNPAWKVDAGTVFGSRFEILAPLGRGGMGMVYRARDRELGETIALKILRPDVARESAQILQRFRSEIRLARKVRHRNVCSVYGDGEHQGLYFICLELVDGVDLRRLARRKEPLTATAVYDLAIQTAEGLQAIHDTGIIHRDLKSSNIMRDARGVVRLMDFGIAKQHGVGTDATATAPATATGGMVGTLEYMSPEHIRGEVLDFRSDLYSLGIVIFELFTGRLPFRGDTPAQTMMRQLQAAPPLDGPEAGALPRPLIPVLRKLLAKNRDERYGSARAVGEALRAAQAGHLPAEGLPATSSNDSRAHAIANTRTAASPEATPSPALTIDSAVRGPAGRPRTWRRARLLGLLPAAAVVAAIGVWLEPIFHFHPRVSPPPPPSAGAERSATAPTPSPPATALAASGSLRVEGEPRGARVTVDGKFSGLTPLEITMLPAGPHKVAIEMAGRETWSGPVTIEGGTTVILALRQPLPPAAPPQTLAAIPHDAPTPSIAVAATPPAPTEPPRVYLETEIDTPPRKLSGGRPTPGVPMRSGESSEVTVSYVVTEKGEVADIEVLASGGAALDKAVIDAVRTWKYSPGQRQGTLVRVSLAIKFRFTAG